jgi:hypothetical protein
MRTRINKLDIAKIDLLDKIEDFIDKNNLLLELDDSSIFYNEKIYLVERGKNLKEKKLTSLNYMYLGLDLPKEFESEMSLMSISACLFYFNKEELVYTSEDPFNFDDNFENMMVYEEQRQRYLEVKEKVKSEVKLISEFIKSLVIPSNKKLYNKYNTCHLESVRSNGKDKKGNEIKLKLVNEKFKDTYDDVDTYYYDLKNEIAYKFVDNSK